MADTIFSSAFFFENDEYQEFEDNVYSGKKQVKADFDKFLKANLKELEFKRKKNKNNNTYDYVFEEDKSHKARVMVETDGIHIFALYDNEENDEINEEIVDRDNGESFARLMDRILDALEVIECAMFEIETKVQTNVSRTAAAIKKGKELSLKLKNKKAKKKSVDDYDPNLSESESESEVSDSENESLDSESNRRSARLKSKKVSKTKSKSAKNGNSNRKRKRKASESDNESEESETEKPKRKRRRVQSEFKKMKKEFLKSWNKGEYVKAMHFAEDEHDMTSKEIDEIIDETYE